MKELSTPVACQCHVHRPVVALSSMRSTSQVLLHIRVEPRWQISLDPTGIHDLKFKSFTGRTGGVRQCT